MNISESDVPAFLERDCEDAFLRLDAGLMRILEPQRRVPICRYRLRDKGAFNARIRQPGHTAHLAMVEMNRGTLEVLHQSIVGSSADIVSAVMPTDKIDIDADQLLTSVYDVAIHFILLHELYHIYEGHLDFLSQLRGRHSLAEVEQCFTGDDPVLDLNTAYYLEMEADGSALVSLLTHVSFQSIVEQASSVSHVNTEHAFVQDLTDEARLFGYRIIACAVWMVGALMETSRPKGSRSVLPIARMLSMISTLMSWFIEANELVENEHGELIQRLNDQQPALIARFLNEVAKPVIVALWQFPGSAADTNTALFRTPIELEQFLRDMQSLIGRQPPSSPFAQQIITSESLRSTLEKQLAPYRYFFDQ